MKRLLFLLVLLPACHRNTDTSTDEGVRNAYKCATGKELPSDRQWTCVDRVSEFPKAVKIGGFPNDAGCRYQGVLYGCRFAPGDTLEKQILGDAGWAKADPAKKQKLLESYWRGVNGVSFPDEADFPKDHAFAPLTFTWNPDGSATMTYWSAVSHGMTPGSHYARHEDHVNADGSPGSSKVLEEFDTGH